MRAENEGGLVRVRQADAYSAGKEEKSLASLNHHYVTNSIETCSGLSSCSGAET